MKALILAAGYATRLFPYTANEPKALLPIRGRSMLDRLLEKIDALPDVTERVLVTNHKFAARFEEWKARAGYPITIIDDGTTSDADKLGAIGDMRLVLEKVGNDDDWFVAASDNLFSFPLTELHDAYARFGKNPMVCAVRIAEKEKLKGFAVAELDERGRVMHLVEKPKEPKTDLGVFALYFYPRDAMGMLDAYAAAGNSMDSPGNFPAWLYKQRDMYCHICSDAIYDIGTVEEYERLRDEYPES